MIKQNSITILFTFILIGLLNCSNKEDTPGVCLFTESVKEECIRFTGSRWTADLALEECDLINGTFSEDDCDTECATMCIDNEGFETEVTVIYNYTDATCRYGTVSKESCQ
ncbi:MAG: hypothetical protein OEZ22_11370 [Spirochaetia bacterium]|nr:hypothetical protein [Spirochaetia bacterium]